MDLRLILEKFRINAGISESLYNLLDISSCNTYSYKNELPKRISFIFSTEVGNKPYLMIEKIEGGYKVFFNLSWLKRENIGMSQKDYTYELTYNLLGELVNYMVSFSFNKNIFSSNKTIFFIDTEGIYDENWNLIKTKSENDIRPAEEIINYNLSICESATNKKEKEMIR